MKIDKYVIRYSSILIAMFAGVFITHGMMPEALLAGLIAISLSSGLLTKSLENETKK